MASTPPPTRPPASGRCCNGGEDSGEDGNCRCGEDDAASEDADDGEIGERREDDEEGTIGSQEALRSENSVAAAKLEDSGGRVGGDRNSEEVDVAVVVATLVGCVGGDRVPSSKVE